MEFVLAIFNWFLVKLPAILGLCLLTGYTGLFSFGHAGFVMIGAYSAAVVTRFWGLAALGPFGLLAGVVFGAIVAAVLAAALGRITLNLKGDYFCLVTLGFGEVVRTVIENLSFLNDSRGIQGIALLAQWYVMLPICVILVAVLALVVGSRHGRNMIAIREEELAAKMSGIDTFKYKMVSFITSAAYAAVTGALWAHFQGTIMPKSFRMDVSTELTIIVIIGGIGSISGSVLAALVVLWLPKQFPELAAWRFVITGAFVVAIMIFRPKGLMGGIELTPNSIKSAWKRWQLARADRLALERDDGKEVA